MINKELENERKTADNAVFRFNKDFENSLLRNEFGNSQIGTMIMSSTVCLYADKISTYLNDYKLGKAVRNPTFAANVITSFNNIELVAFIAIKVIFNSLLNCKPAKVTTVAKAIGQALNDEYQVQQCKLKNPHYFNRIKKDLEKRGAKGNWIKTVIQYVFAARLEFIANKWSVTEMVQTGLVLLHLFVESTNFVEFIDEYIKNKHYKMIAPTKELMKLTENLCEKLSLLHPFYLPMVCKPKEWVGTLEGGYLLPYFKKNRLIKNSSKDYLIKLEKTSMPVVYEAINHLQNTEWHINLKVLNVAKALWEEGKAVAGFPNRDDATVPPFPFPNKRKEDVLTKSENEIVKAWKREVFSIRKKNIQQRSVRLLVGQIIRLANQFCEYEKIWFPYTMDYRGRLYPINPLLQPQGTDLAKGLLEFAQGKLVQSNTKAIEWLEIHGANTFGFDKESYKKRIEWVRERQDEIKSFANNPLKNREWMSADKPFQFLAFCFEYNDYLTNPNQFKTHLPIQLDGTCNGLQHYSALMKDEVAGKAVNLLDGEQVEDIYSLVANRLQEKLEEIVNGQQR